MVILLWLGLLQLHGPVALLGQFHCTVILVWYRYKMVCLACGIDSGQLETVVLELLAFEQRFLRLVFVSRADGGALLSFVTSLGRLDRYVPTSSWEGV